MTFYNGYIYFGSNTNSKYRALHQMDHDGTMVEAVYDVNPNGDDSISKLNAVGDYLYFAADHEQGVDKLFRLDDVTRLQSLP